VRPNASENNQISHSTTVLDTRGVGSRRSSRPSRSKAEKREYSWQIGSHPGNPGLEQAVKLVVQMKAAAEGKGDFSEIVMPNGRKLSECTFGYLSEIGEAMEIMGLAATRNF